MLKRCLPIFALLAFSTQASAATLTGVSTVSENGKRAEASRSVSLLELAASGMIFSFKTVTGQTGHDQSDRDIKSAKHNQCTDDKSEAVVGDKKQKSMSGPEPVYFGF